MWTHRLPLSFLISATRKQRFVLTYFLVYCGSCGNIMTTWKTCTLISKRPLPTLGTLRKAARLSYLVIRVLMSPSLCIALRCLGSMLYLSLSFNSVRVDLIRFGWRVGVCAPSGFCMCVSCLFIKDYSGSEIKWKHEICILYTSVSG